VAINSSDVSAIYLVVVTLGLPQQTSGLRHSAFFRVVPPFWLGRRWEGFACSDSAAGEGFEEFGGLGGGVVLGEIGLYAPGVFSVGGLGEDFLDGFADRQGPGAVFSQVDSGSRPLDSCGDLSLVLGLAGGVAEFKRAAGLSFESGALSF
jgi:hypothetical protein